MRQCTPQRNRAAGTSQEAAQAGEAGTRTTNTTVRSASPGSPLRAGATGIEISSPSPAIRDRDHATTAYVRTGRWECSQVMSALGLVLFVFAIFTAAMTINYMDGSIKGDSMSAASTAMTYIQLGSKSLYLGWEVLEVRHFYCKYASQQMGRLSLFLAYFKYQTARLENNEFNRHKFAHGLHVVLDVGSSLANYIIMKRMMSEPMPQYYMYIPIFIAIMFTMNDSLGQIPAVLCKAPANETAEEEGRRKQKVESWKAALSIGATGTLLLIFIVV